MNLQDRIKAFIKLGELLSIFKEKMDWKGYESGLTEFEHNEVEKAIERAKIHNGWFTDENVRNSFSAISSQLCSDNIEKWVSNYHINDQSHKTIAVIMAGNIPLVGFHDALSVLISGHNLLVKMSSDDNQLLPIVFGLLVKIAPDFKSKIKFAENKLSDFDAVIATGSDNSARYFEQYFGKYPHIIRKNRTSIAIINGFETEEELKALADDVFQYFGLGCRNITKLYLPKGYDLDKLFGAFYHYDYVMDNKKYANNYDYHKAIFLMNQDVLIENGFLLMKEDNSIHSPISTLFYEYYSDESEIRTQLQAMEDKIQCIVSKSDIPFGKAQQPNLWDYADGVDTMQFLNEKV